MPWGVVAFGVVVTLVAWFVLRSWRRASAQADVRLIDPFESPSTAEIAEIEHRLAAIMNEESSAHDRRMALLVQRLVDRQVPARAVEIAPGFREIRIRFADGTAMLARGDTAGDLGILAAVIQDRSATPSSCVLATDGAHVTFVWPGIHRRLSVRIIGVDQPS